MSFFLNDFGILTILDIFVEFTKMISILSAYPETKNYWEYNENACWYSKSFVKKNALIV